MLETNLIGTVDKGKSGALVLKYEGSGFLSKNKYVPINMGQKNTQNFLDMIDGKENYINDFVKIFIDVTKESVNEVQLYCGIQGNYMSDLVLGNNTYHNVEPHDAMIFGLIGNSDVFVNEELLLNEEETKIKLGLIPDKKFLDKNLYKKVKKWDEVKKLKKSKLDEIIKFKNIKEFRYMPNPKHMLNKEDYQKMDFKKDEDFSSSFQAPISMGSMGIAIVRGRANNTASRFSFREREFILPRQRDEDFELKSCYDAQEKRYDIYSLLSQILKDYGIDIEEIYFETEIDKHKNDKEIRVIPKDTFVELKKSEKSEIIYVDNELPLFLHFSKNVNIKINKGINETDGIPYR